MWNPIKAYTDHRDAKNAEYQRQERRARQEREARRAAERAEIRKLEEADQARRDEINRPGNEAWAARQAERRAAKEAAKAAETAKTADIFAKALVNNGIQVVGNGRVDARGAVWGTGSPESEQRVAEGMERARHGQERAAEARESGQGSGGIVNYGQDVDVSGQAFGWGSSINSWGPEADSPKAAEADWGGWDSSSLESSLGGSVATYGGDEASL